MKLKPYINPESQTVWKVDKTPQGIQPSHDRLIWLVWFIILSLLAIGLTHVSEIQVILTHAGLL